MWSYLTTERFFIRALLTFVVIGLVGVGISEAMRLVGQKESTGEANVPQQAKPTPPVQQQSSGANSPNTNVQGNNNTTTVIVNPPAPPAKNPPKKDEKTSDIAEGAFLGGGFKENPNDADVIGVRIGGYYTGNPRAWLKEGRLLKPVTIGPEGATPITVGLDKDGRILLNCTISGGDEAHPFQIEIKNNVFTVASKFVQKNYNDKALEVADDDGVPLFQVIQESKNQLRINGILVLYPDKEGKMVRLWAWDGHADINPEKPKDFLLKPIFKYPSWKYLGQYAD